MASQDAAWDRVCQRTRQAGESMPPPSALHPQHEPPSRVHAPFAGLQAGFLQPGRGGRGGRGRYGRRASQRLPCAAPHRLEAAIARPAFSSILDTGVLATREVPSVAPLLKGIQWNEELKHSAYVKFITDPERAEFEHAWGEFMDGTPDSSDRVSSSEDKGFQELSAYALRGRDRGQFLRWWKRKLARQTPEEAAEWAEDVEDTRKQLLAWQAPEAQAAAGEASGAQAPPTPATEHVLGRACCRAAAADTHR